MRLSRRLVLLWVLTAGCGPWSNPPSAEDGSTGGTTTGFNTTQEQPGTTSPSSTTIDGETTETSCAFEDDGMGERCTPPPTTTTVSFIEPTTSCGYDPDLPGQPRCSPECSVWEQDCLDADEKCVPWSNDGSGVWNDTRCAPVDPVPAGVGEPCTVQGGGASGIDDCEAGHVCWGVDSETLQGTCVVQCDGTPETPACDNPDTTCVIAAEGVVNLCLPTCSPLEPDACIDGEGCYAIGDEFVCLAFGTPLTTSGPCSVPAQCEPGSTCIGDVACEEPPCCAAWCDTADPDPICPDATTCSPYFEPAAAPEGFETLGVCAP